MEAAQLKSTVTPKRCRHAEVRAALLARREIALLDVREEDPHAQAHPLFAANLPLSRLELEVHDKLPRRDVDIVVLDGGEGHADVAAKRLIELGYTRVAVLEGGIDGWAEDGGELFRDVNAPSKAFGEWVEAHRHTPSVSAEDLLAQIESGADILVVDARRFDEYQTMSIPSGTSVPGAELALRVPGMVSSPATQVVVNCAGRTRSIIGAQSLVNVGLANPVAALRNGTIGWTLAGQALAHGQQKRHETRAADGPAPLAGAARRLADRAGVQRCTSAQVQAWARQDERSTYFFDVRTPEEFAAGRLPEFRSVPGGQLVQETDMVAPVRGARIVLTDTDGVRANMSASWLAQMNWEVHVLDGVSAGDFKLKEPPPCSLPPLPDVAVVTPGELSQWLHAERDVVVLDFSRAAQHAQGHIPGAWWVIRSDLAAALAKLPPASCYVLSSDHGGLLARFACADVRRLVDARVLWLEGGNEAWFLGGLAKEPGLRRLASPLIDRYRRPYEGTDNPREAMQAYLDWEFGLVEQLGQDGTHGFKVL